MCACMYARAGHEQQFIHLPHSYLAVRFAFVLACRSYASRACVVAAADIFIAIAALAFEYPELLICQQVRQEDALAT